MDWEILTARQREILSLLADGWLIGEVAKKQSASAMRIHVYLRDIYNALKVRMGRRYPAYAIYKAWYFGEITLPKYLGENLEEMSDE